MSKAAWRELRRRGGQGASERARRGRERSEWRAERHGRDTVPGGGKRSGGRKREREREESRPSRWDGARGGQAVEARRDREESARTHTKRRTVSRGGLGGESEAVGWRRVGW